MVGKNFFNKNAYGIKHKFHVSRADTSLFITSVRVGRGTTRPTSFLGIKNTAQ